jgi:ATP-dependent RNA helicase HelY
VITKIPLPRSGSVRNPRYRRDVAGRLATIDASAGRRRGPRVDPRVEREASALEERARTHPCRSCPELAKHERWASRAGEVRRRLAGVERRIRVRTETLARQFDRVLSVLRDLRYVEGWSLTTKGRTLTRIYGEGDLLVGEALGSGLLEDLEPAELVALLSAVVYEGRERIPLSGEMPTAETKERYERLQRLWRKIRRAEDEHQVQLCRELEAGFAAPIHRWAEGEALDDVLAETDMAPGDFVRNCKQLADLLRQIEDVAAPETATLVRRGREAILRGVVAYTGV